jgi:hypothetical protein
MINKGDFEEMRRLFKASKEGLGREDYFSCEDFGRSLWRFWRAMKEKLWD